MTESTEEATPELTPSEQLVNHIINQNLAKATPVFNDLLQDRLNVAMDQEKQKIANVTFNGAEAEESDPNEEEQLDLDLDDTNIESEEDQIVDADSFNNKADKMEADAES